MNKLDSLLKQIKNQGERLTPIRKNLLQILIDTPHPISSIDMLEKLSKQLHAHKTTIYREVIFLQKQKLINSIDFGDGIKRYELTEREHHHHLVCTNCGMITDIPYKDHLRDEESQVMKNFGFKVLRHSLEFFGQCQNCQ